MRKAATPTRAPKNTAELAMSRCLQFFFLAIFEFADLEHTYVGGASSGREFMIASFAGMGTRPINEISAFAINSEINS